MIRGLARGAEQLNVAYDFDIGLTCETHGPMRLRVRERNARCQHQRGDFRPVEHTEVFRMQTLRLRLPDFPFVIVPGDDFGIARGQRARSQQARTAEAENCDPFPRKRGDWDHLNFSVASPASANTTATIQNRITT